MKQTMKKCLTLLLALALLFTMVVPAAAATPYDKSITFTDVAQGDTVKAYQVMKYDTDYNAYIFDEGFKKAIGQYHEPEDTAFDKFYAEINTDVLKELMVYYSDTRRAGVLQAMMHLLSLQPILKKQPAPTALFP